MVRSRNTSDGFDEIQRVCARNWHAFLMRVAAGTSIAGEVVAVLVWSPLLFGDVIGERLARVADISVDSPSILGWITGLLGLGAAFHARSWALAGELSPSRRLTREDENQVLGRIRFHHQVSSLVAIGAVTIGLLAIAASSTAGHDVAAAVLCLLTALGVAMLLAETAGVPESLGSTIRRRVRTDERLHLRATLPRLRPDVDASRLRMVAQVALLGGLQAGILGAI